MKKIFFLLFIQICFLQGKAQKVYANENDVFSSPSFHFYGYDESKLKFVDTSRFGQDYKKFMVGFNELMFKKFNQKEFEIIYQKKKGNIPFNPVPTQSGFDKIDFGKFVVSACQKIPDDSLAAMVKNYQLSETKGLGSVIVFDCFNRLDMTIELNMLFFDISTRKIIYSKNLISKDKNGYNYMADWKKGAIIAMERLLKATSKDFEAYNDKKTKKK